MKLRIAIAVATAITGASAVAQVQPPAPGGQAGDVASLEQQFRDPPSSARPRVWWHWMNGNVSKEGIAKDLAWMKRVGIGGLQNFDANMTTPQIVPDRLIYMTPEWKDAFRFAAVEADRLGLELAIASSPGWSETGGPWVKPEDGLKKLVWSETDLAAGRRYTGRLSVPPSTTGPYQAVPKAASMGELGAGKSGVPATTHYADVAVLAVPLIQQRGSAPIIRDGQGKLLEAAALSDDDLVSEYVVAAGGTTEEPRTIVLEYERPQTIRSARLFAPKGGQPFIGNLFRPRLEASDDGQAWRRVADLPLGAVPATVAFAPVTAGRFRVVLAPRREALDILSQYGPGIAQRFGITNPDALFARPIPIADLQLSSEDRIDHAEAKAAFSLSTDYHALSAGVPEAGGVLPG